MMPEEMVLSVVSYIPELIVIEECVSPVIQHARHVLVQEPTNVHCAKMDPSCWTAPATNPVQIPTILKRVNVCHVTTTVRHAEVGTYPN